VEIHCKYSWFLLRSLASEIASNVFEFCFLFQFFFPVLLLFFISSAMLDISGLLSRFVLFGMPNACKTICSSLFVLLFLWNSFRVYYFVLLGSSWRDLVEIHSVYLAQTCKGFRLCFLFSKHFPHFSCALSRPILT